MPAFGGLDRIDVADNIGNRHIGSCQLFDKARIAIDPGDRRGILMQLNRLPAVRADRMIRIIVDFRTGNDRNLIVEKICKLANDAALCLATQAQQNQIVPREDRIDELRNNRLVIANNAGKQFLAPLEFANQIRAHLVFD